MRTMRWPRSVDQYAFRICGSIAVIALLALGGCSSEDEPNFMGVEEQQKIKEAEEHRGESRTTTAPQ